MKVVILAGGVGSRLAEETQVRPKPMVEIGEKPILWHIMKIYSKYGFDDFIICLGYKGYVIKEYFHNYFLHNCNVTLDVRNQQLTVHQNEAEHWKVTLVDTGADTMTGGRVKRVQPYVDNERFMMTYGDGLADIEIDSLAKYHDSHGKMATVTAVKPIGRFGAMDIKDSQEVRAFQEKPDGDGSWINGGFFVLEPSVFDYIEGDHTFFEREPLSRLADDGNLKAFKHKGFWKPMDTLREKEVLDGMWASGKAPWKVW